MENWLNGLYSFLPWENSKVFLASDFFAAFFGSLVGAVAAYLVTARSERLKIGASEIAACNAAIALSHGVINTAISLKDQHVIGMLSRFRKTFEGWASAEMISAKTGQPNTFTSFFDIRTFSIPSIPADRLQTLIMERVHFCGRAQVVAGMVQQSTVNLIESIKNRNDAIAKIEGKPTSVSLPLYFGLRNSSGHVDERYPDYLTHIAQSLDDCIYFGMLLQEILYEHGKQQRGRIWWGAQKVHRFIYKRSAHLHPDRTRYADIEAQFRPEPFPKLYKLGKWIAWAAVAIRGTFKKG